MRDKMKYICAVEKSERSYVHAVEYINSGALHTTTYRTLCGRTLAHDNGWYVVAPEKDIVTCVQCMYRIRRGFQVSKPNNKVIDLRETEDEVFIEETPSDDPNDKRPWRSLVIVEERSGNMFQLYAKDYHAPQRYASIKPQV